MAVDACHNHFLDAKSRKLLEGSIEYASKPVFIAKVSAGLTTTVEDDSDSWNLLLQILISL
jgi:hypothetical protein